MSQIQPPHCRLSVTTQTVMDKSASLTIRRAGSVAQEFLPKRDRFDGSILEVLVEQGHERKLFSGVPLDSLFLPEKGCHIELTRYPKGRVHFMGSIKNHRFQSNDGRFHHIGVAHGMVIKFRENGTIENKSYWKNAQQDGPSTFYEENGEIRSQTYWIKDQKVSKLDYFQNIENSTQSHFGVNAPKPTLPTEPLLFL